MTDLRKAAEQVLEAHDEGYGKIAHDVALENLREALAQPEQEPVAIVNEGMGGIEWLSKPLPDDTPLYTAPVDAINMSQKRVDETAKCKHEPEWIDDGFGTMWKKCGKKDCGKFVVKIGKVDCWNGDCPETNAPLKREWVGLTDEQRHEFVRNYGGDVISKLALVKAIEAKLNEKNT